MDGCRKHLGRPQVRDCDACGFGPCLGHDCNLGNQISNFNFVTPTFPLTIQREKWRRQKRKKSRCNKCGETSPIRYNYRGALLCPKCNTEATGVVNKAFDDWLKSPEKTERDWLDIRVKMREYGTKQIPDCPDCGERLRSFGFTQFYCVLCGEFYKE